MNRTLDLNLRSRGCGGLKDVRTTDIIYRSEGAKTMDGALANGERQYFLLV